MTVIPLNPSRLNDGLARVRTRIDRATVAAGRTDEVQLLPVTKAVDLDVTRALMELGETDLAENRVTGLEEKAAALEGVRWHFIGHLQRNKARRVVRHAAVIHSVDSLRLVETLERLAGEEGRSLDVFLQVDFTGDEAKHGMDEVELREALTAACEAAALTPVGLMAMAPREGRPEPVFERVSSLASELRSSGLGTELSMGMSSDLEAAIAAGSTCVRIGTDLYREVMG